MRVLITGSNGFIGRYLSAYLSERGESVVDTYRTMPDELLNDSSHYAVGDIHGQTDWQSALSGVDVVVHLAARVHVMQETQADPLSAFRQVNTEGTLNLAQQALDAGVKRFIYLSSIKVNGEQTTNNTFKADDRPDPKDPYAVSKLESEQKLIELVKESGMDVVIIRPPLVYGPGVKGNFKRLVSVVKKSIPLPLAKIENARSLVNIQNLCSLINTCLSHPDAANEVFLVSDGHDLSTSELFESISTALNTKSRLFYVPGGIIWALTCLLGKRAEFERLFGSLQVDIGKNKRLLGWTPTTSVQQGIKEAID